MRLFMGMAIILSLVVVAGGDKNIVAVANASAPPGNFTVQGTVYNAATQHPLPDATVTIFPQPLGRGTPILSVRTDAEGNFSSDVKLDLSAGAYASVKGPKTARFMSTPIPRIYGSCASCHGQSVPEISVE